MHRIRYSCIFSLIAALFSALCCDAPARAATTYYVSQSLGNDAADGRATTADGAHGPWKTLAKASTITYRAGDRLLLQCGEVWNEPLTLRGSGSAEDPVTVSSYGEGERPFIRRSAGNRTACVIVDKASNYSIRDLELGFAQNAIRFVADSRVAAAMGGYRIENCLIHDTANPIFPDRAKNEGRQHNDYRNMGWAMFVDAFDSPRPVHLTGISVRHCLGLRTQGFFMPMGAVSLEDVRFEGNTVAHNSFNSIYQVSAKRFAIVDSVFVYSYPWEFHPNGSTQVLAGGITGNATERNEVRGNEFGWAGDYPGCPDGCAYDFEGATSGVTFQRNFLHNTFGEAVLFMPNCHHAFLLFDGNIFRNNVRFSPTWNVEVTLFPNNSGNGTFSNNVFFPRPGIRTINSKPACFTFSNNDEKARGDFVAMPLVRQIQYDRAARTYTLACSTAGAAIRYTLDGSLPTSASEQYTGPIRVQRSGALNVKAFKAGLYPSSVNALGVELRDQAGEGLVAHWKLDETSGTVAVDSRAGLNGLLDGCRWIEDHKVRCLEFDGQKDSVALDSASLGKIANEFTVSFWAAPRGKLTIAKETGTGNIGISGQRYALYPGHMGERGDAGFGVSIGINGVSVFEHAANYLPAVLMDPRPLSGWNHVTVVYRNRQPTLYFNGIYEKAGCKSTKNVHPVFQLGGTPYGWYDGKLRELRVYNRALTDAEIQVLANPLMDMDARTR